MWIIYLCMLQCPDYSSGIQTGSIQDAGLNEISGIVVSQINPGILWVHNDSGGDAAVTAINTEGYRAATLHLSGVTVLDVEDIAAGTDLVSSRHLLFLGDIGDNNATRSHITVYQLPEPIVYHCQDVTGAIDLFQEPIPYHLTYPDGPRDAETLLYDPQTNDLFIVSKRDFPVGRLYRVPQPRLPHQLVELEYILDIQMAFPVGGNVSHDGSSILIKNYLQPFQDQAFMWYRQEGSNLWDAFSSAGCLVPLIQEPQGEAIAFDPFTCGYFTISEGFHQPLYYFQPDQPCNTALVPAYPGDFNFDLVLNEDDRKAAYPCWRQNAQSGTTCQAFDINLNGTIQILDFTYHVTLEANAECLEAYPLQ